MRTAEHRVSDNPARGVGFPRALMGTATGLAVTWLHARKQPLISGFLLIPRQDGLALAWGRQF